jgi:O-antigen ligase
MKTTVSRAGTGRAYRRVVEGGVRSPGQAWAGAALAAAAVVLFAFRDGGYDDPGSWRAAIVALLAVCGLALVLGRPARPCRLALVALLGLAAFSGWTALSALWSSDPAASLVEAQRAALYVALVAAALAVGGWLLPGTVAGIALVCAYAVGDRIVHGTPEFDPFEGTLLHEPLGYANALAGLTAIGVAAVAVLALRRRWRLPAATLAALFLVTLALTGSRGGWFAALAGCAVGLALALRRARLAAAAGTVAGLVLALALVLPAGSLAHEEAGRVGDRAWYWHVAWVQARDTPLAGRGAGTFELAWLEQQPIGASVRDAHSLYLENLAELGLVGLALLALALVPPLLAASPRTAAAAGAYTAFLVHAGADWDWEMPAVTGAGLLCGAALLHSAYASAGEVHYGPGCGTHPPRRPP